MICRILGFFSENINGCINSKKVRWKETPMGWKTHHNKSKTDFLKEIKKKKKTLSPVDHCSKESKTHRFQR